MKVRRALGEDAVGIGRLVSKNGGTSKYRQRYGAYNVASLIEMSYVSLISEDEKGEIKSFLALSDGPRGASCREAEEWLDQVEKALKLPLAIGNTLWIEFSVTEDEKFSGIHSFELALKEAVRILPWTEHLILTAKAKAPEVENLFDTLPLLSNLGTENDLKLWYQPRSKFVPTLYIREASVEDSDDLDPIFHRQAQGLRQQFGDFVLADLIASNAALVCSSQSASSQALGLLALSDEIDFNVLSRHFFLEEYNELQKNKMPNAFAITFFCLEEQYQSRAHDFFHQIFQTFPDRDYCIITAPTTMATDSWLLKHFTPVSAKANSNFTHSLFLLHRDPIHLAHSQLKLLRFNPKFHTTGSLKSLASSDPVFKDALETRYVPNPDDEEDAIFCALVDNTIVALATLSRANASTTALNVLKAKYQLETIVPWDRHKTKSHAFITGLAIHPIYAKCAPYILKEIMRKYNKTVLYFQKDYDLFLQDQKKKPPPTILSDFVPVNPRHCLLASSASDNSASNKETISAGPLYCITRKLTSMPCRIVNTRILVLGYTTCTIALLREILFRSDLKCVAITVLSGADLERHHSSKLRHNDEDFPLPFELEALGLQQRVRFIKASASRIFREQKVVLTTDDAELQYDVLVISSALKESTQLKVKHFRSLQSDDTSSILSLSTQRYQNLAAQLAGEDKNDDTKHEANDTSSKDSLTTHGLISLSSGTVSDPDIIARAESAGPVIVYGGTLTALAAVHALLAAGIRVRALVAPQFDSLGDAVMDRVVMSRLAGVEVHENYHLCGFIYNKDILTAARFLRRTPSTIASKQDEVMKIDCGLILSADVPDVPLELFDTLNEAGLVYDGRLVVDARFRTTDAAIFAAGPVAKFSDVYKGYGLSLYHDRGNENELGTLLAQSLLCHILGQLPTVKDETPPVLKLPRTLSASLPGNLLYVRSSLPLVPDDCKLLPTGLIGEFDSQFDCPLSAFNNDGSENLAVDTSSNTPRGNIRSLRELTSSRERFSVLKIDSLGVVTDFIYLGSAQHVEARKLGALVGVHEAYLNSAASSYNQGLIDDWITFLAPQSPGTVAVLLHDRFSELQATLRDVLKYDKSAEDIVNSVLVSVAIQQESAATISANFIDHGVTNIPQATRDAIDHAVLGFIRKNRAELPRFSLPVPQRNVKNTSAIQP